MKGPFFLPFDNLTNIMVSLSALHLLSGRHYLNRVLLLYGLWQKNWSVITYKLTVSVDLAIFMLGFIWIFVLWSICRWVNAVGSWTNTMIVWTEWYACFCQKYSFQPYVNLLASLCLIEFKVWIYYIYCIDYWRFHKHVL